MRNLDFWQIVQCASSLPLLVFGVIVFKKDRLVSMLLISAAVLSIGLVLNAINIIYWLYTLKLPYPAQDFSFRFFSIAMLVPWMLLLTAAFIRRGPGGTHRQTPAQRTERKTGSFPG